MLRTLLLLLSGGAALFHLYSAGVAPFTALVQRPVHLAFMATLGFLGVGARIAKRSSGEGARESGRWKWIATFLTWVLILAVVASAFYLVSENEALVRRAGSPTTLDLVGGKTHGHPAVI